MTAAETASDSPVLPPGKLRELGRTADALLDRLSEWLNPILIKEARQSLKSRLFIVIFVLVLVLGWGWSFLGISLMSPDIYFAPGGPVLLTGYVWILLFPLFVVIPFSAFHSLASERDDGTDELVSITTLRPWQIVSGRIAVSVLQMLIFLSALAPCIAFTYLLRGIDLLSIALLLVSTTGVSLLLTSAALFLGSLGKARYMRIFLAMVLIIALLAVFIWMAMGITEMLVRSVQFPYELFQFWTALAATCCAAGSMVVLLVVATAAQITFVSENRSTKLRLVMLAQQALLVGWGAWYFYGEKNEGGLFVPAFVGPIYWVFMGALMVAESPVIYQRARRTLPQSFLGRVFLTWLQPGPGTGYVFAIANLWALTATMLSALTLAFVEQSNDYFFVRQDNLVEMVSLLLAWACYATIYLGITRLIVSVLRPFMKMIPIVGVIVGAIVIVLATTVPFVLQTSFATTFEYYTLWQLPNPFATIDEIGRGNMFAYQILGIPVIPIALPAAMLPILLANLLLAGREVRRLREQAPERVLAEDAAKLPAKPEVVDPLR